MICTRCDAVSPATNRFCDECGAPLEPACPSCGRANRSGARFCADCGHALSGQPAPAATTPPPASLPEKPAPLAALLASRFARDGERKQVTVLLADIRGSTELIEKLDPEAAMQRLEPVLQAMIEAVQKYGGTVNRTQGDGIMALFGAPLAYEDHAVRACYAAWAMQDAVSRLGEDFVETRVGLNSGEVVVRAIDRDVSSEYDVVGSTAHLAARIEQLARPQTTWMSGATARLARGFIQLRSCGVFDLKGLSTPLELFELVAAPGQTRWAARASTASLGRFIGRETEARMLSDALGRAKAGRGQVVAIVGEAGMGKSRLVHEFLEGAGKGFSLAAAAMPHDHNAPYRLIAGAMRIWLGVGDQDGQSSIDEKLVGATMALDGPASADLAPLRFLLDLPTRSPAWDALDAAQRRSLTHAAVLSLVFKVAGTAPFVLVLEDLHWADAESRSVIDAIVDRMGASKLLLVATCRPEHKIQWTQYRHTSLVQLGPLDAESADALLKNLLGATDELAPLRDRVIEQSAGTPFFLEEMVRALVETGVLVDKSDSYRLTRNLEDVEVPQSVRAVLASRIDRLPPAERALLQIASVIGKEAPVSLLGEVSGILQELLERQLSELRSQEFVYELRRPTGYDYSFRHALTHATTYESMLIRHRRALHANVLTAIEDHFAERLDEFTERLADHAMHGQVWDKAVAYCRKAGDRANARSAHRVAAVFFRQALDALGHLTAGEETTRQAIDIRLGLRVALAAAAEFPSVIRYLNEAEELARSIGDDRRLMPIVISRATILSNLGDLDEALRAGLQGRELAMRQSDETAIISSGFALGQAYWNRGEFAQAETILSETIGIPATGAPKQSAGTTGNAYLMCLVALTHTHSLTGNLGGARAHSAEALRIATETGRPYDLSYAHAARGLMHLTLGEDAEAAGFLAEALRIAQGADIALLVPHAARYLGRAFLLTGQSAQATALLERATEQAGAQALRGLQGWCSAALALSRQCDGETAKAAQSAAIAVAIARQHGYRPLLAHALRVAASIAAGGAAEGAQDPDRIAYAASLLDEAAALAEELGMRPERALCWHQIAELQVRAGNPAPAVAAVTTAIELFQQIGMRRDAEAARRLQATLATTCPADPHAVWRSARAG